MGGRFLPLALTAALASGFCPLAARAESTNRPASAPASNPAGTHLAAGDLAPDFPYNSLPYGWRRFHDLCREGAVLLVFEAGDDELLALAQEADRLERAGVTVVAVRARRSTENWAAIERLGLRYRLFSDPNGVVAASFGALDPLTGRPAPGWCLVDTRGHVRSIARGAAPAKELADRIGVEFGLTPVVASDEPR